MWLLAAAAALFFIAAPAVFARPIGDTLTVIMRPILGVPAIRAAGETLEINASAPPSTDGWSVELLRPPCSFPLDVAGATYNSYRKLWTLRAPIPLDLPETLYDLAVHAAGGVADTTRRAVKILSRYEDDWCFAHVTDTHLPGHTYYGGRGWEADSTEMADFRAVIDDLNLIAPELVLLTGDFVNEGEAEDLNEYRAYSRAQRLLLELDVPVFLVAGNHDVGGWRDTPPPDGTARRNWWRFFGWPYLDDPPDRVTTQNYFFDYGPVRFIGLEAYLNYDGWRSRTYGASSFLGHQLDFLREAADSRPEGSRVVAFYHYDFANQIGDPAERAIDLALYGHIHRDAGSITDPRPVLATEACADGKRAYRIVRVRDGRLGERPTLRAGSRGELLTIEFDAPNDGSRDANAATIVNGHNQPLEFAEVSFVMPKASAPYGASGGTVIREIDADTALVVVARVSLSEGERARVRLEPSDESPRPPVPPVPDAFRLIGSVPNPFNGATEIRFEIPDPGGTVAIELFDVAGRYLFLLARGPFPGGAHAFPWDGRAPSGASLSAGVYFYRVAFEGEARVGRVLYFR